MLTALALLALLGQGIPTEAEAKKAEAKLAEKPDDPAANLAIGKYLAWARSDWEGAGPFIDRGSDVILKKAFQADAAGGKTGPEMIGVGDEWVAAGDKRTELRKLCRERAIHWYAKAWPLVEDPWKLKLRLQFRKLAAPPPGSEKSKKSAGFPAGWVPDVRSAYLESGWGNTGKKCMRLIPSGPESNHSGFHCKEVSAKPGDLVIVSAWVYCSDTDAVGKVNVRFFDSAGRFCGYGGPLFEKDCPWWKKASGEVKVPENAAWMDVNITATIKSGAMWVDDVSLTVDGKELLENGGFEK